MNIKYLNLVFGLLLGLIICLSCTSDTKTHQINRKLLATSNSSVALEATQFEIFNVEDDENGELKKTTLKYKDVKYHRGALLVRQDFYEVNNTLKGFEVITKDKDSGVSNYYSSDSTLLAIYHLAYVPGTNRVMRKEGFDGQTKELLRIETYEYDSATNKMNSKVIFDATGTPIRKFAMKLDRYGNEESVAVMNPDGTAIANESFEIISRDASGKWTERWGKINGKVNTFQRRIFSKNE